MCVCVYMCVCMCMCVHVFVCMCMFMHTHACVLAHCVCARVYACVRVCVHVCVCVRVRAFFNAQPNASQDMNQCGCYTVYCITVRDPLLQSHTEESYWTQHNT